MKMFQNKSFGKNLCSAVWCSMVMYVWCCMVLYDATTVAFPHLWQKQLYLTISISWAMVCTFMFGKLVAPAASCPGGCYLEVAQGVPPTANVQNRTD